MTRQRMQTHRFESNSIYIVVDPTRRKLRSQQCNLHRRPIEPKRQNRLTLGILKSGHGSHWWETLNIENEEDTNKWTDQAKVWGTDPPGDLNRSVIESSSRNQRRRCTYRQTSQNVQGRCRIHRRSSLERSNGLWNSPSSKRWTPDRNRWIGLTYRSPSLPECGSSHKEPRNRRTQI